MAANVGSGAQFGYLLLWVIVAASVTAHSAVPVSKARAGDGRSLEDRQANGTPGPAGLLGTGRIVLMATDVAEVIGRLSHYLDLFNLTAAPCRSAGSSPGVVSLLLLTVQDRRGQRLFERVITALLLVIAIGFCGLRHTTPMRSSAVWHRFQGTESVLWPRRSWGRPSCHAVLPAIPGLARPAQASIRPSAAPAAHHPLGCRPGDADSRQGKRRDAADCRATGPWGHRLDPKAPYHAVDAAGRRSRCSSRSGWRQQRRRRWVLTPA